MTDVISLLTMIETGPKTEFLRVPQDFDAEKLGKIYRVFWDRAGWVQEIPASVLYNAWRALETARKSPSIQAAPKPTEFRINWDQTVPIHPLQARAIQFIDLIK